MVTDANNVDRSVNQSRFLEVSMINRIYACRALATVSQSYLTPSLVTVSEPINNSYTIDSRQFGILICSDHVPTSHCMFSSSVFSSGFIRLHWQSLWTYWWVLRPDCDPLDTRLQHCGMLFRGLFVWHGHWLASKVCWKLTFYNSIIMVES